MREKKDIYNDIMEILVQSQYWFWVKKIEPKNMTEEEIKNSQKEAEDFFLGKTSNLMDMASVEQVRFHDLIEAQAHLIMPILDMSKEDIQVKNKQEYLEIIAQNPELLGIKKLF